MQNLIHLSLRTPTSPLVLELKTLNSSGIIYIATGPKHRAEAISNMRISRDYAPQITSMLVTDNTRDVPSGLFNYIIKHSNPVFGYRDKISHLIDLPFEYSLFLDSDAFLINDPESLFCILSSSHVAAAHAPVRHPPGWSDDLVPDMFPELNTGVLLLKKSRVQRNLIKQWLKLYDKLLENNNQLWDQASFRSVVWRFHNYKRLRLTILPPEANFRLTKPWVAGRGLKVSVVHGRLPKNEIIPLINYLNSDFDRFRTWSEWVTINPKTQIKPRHDRMYL